MKNVAIFASGGGTNADRVIYELGLSFTAHVAVVLTNNPKAGVIEKAEEHDVPVELIDKNWNDAGAILEILKGYEIDTILLLGYLKLLPSGVIDAYDGHILNQHPALLPKYGGKGMYGRRVHEMVAKNSDKQSGYTLHKVTPVYDEGEILWQEKVDLPEGVTGEEVEFLVRKLENEKVAPAIHKLIKDNQI